MPADRRSTGDPERCTSGSWEGPVPDVAVHVPTFDRSGFLTTLVERLEAQTLAAERFEVVVVDNGSTDGTWPLLEGIVGRTPLRMAALRLPANRGPAGARNAAVAASRAPVAAFTDDDCLPEPGWLASLLAAFECADLVQGRTEPDHVASGVWDRTIRIVGPTPLFETCNIAYRRHDLLAAGGFDETSAVAAGPGRRAFGEDVLLGAAVVGLGARRAFAPDAVVRHRYLPGSYPDHLREMRNLAGFPALARLAPPLAEALWCRTFLTRRTAAFDLAVVGVAAAVALRRPLLVLSALPWVRETLPMARERGGRTPLVRLAQLGLADAVGAAALVSGSIRHRRPVL